MLSNAQSSLRQHSVNNKMRPGSKRRRVAPTPMDDDTSSSEEEDKKPISGHLRRNHIDRGPAEEGETGFDDGCDSEEKERILKLVKENKWAFCCSICVCSA